MMPPRRMPSGAPSIQADRLFKLFRSGFLGKVSPVHFFWGGFDLAVTRFSGRRAPLHPGGFPGLPDAVTREAYSHEVSSAGFWPGNDMFPHAAFYSYAWPEPDGFRDARVPDGASFDQTLGEFILPYDAVRAASDPDRLVLDFLTATYAAAAQSGKWDRSSLECEIGVPNRVRPLSSRRSKSARSIFRVGDRGRFHRHCPFPPSPNVFMRNPGVIPMAEFVYLYRGGERPASAEQTQQIMQKWMAWFKQLGEKGPHHRTPVIRWRRRQGGEGQQKDVTDGPFAEAKDVVGGYTLVQASDLGQAAELPRAARFSNGEGGGSTANHADEHVMDPE